MFYEPLDRKSFISLCKKDFANAKKLVSFKRIHKEMVAMNWAWARVDGCGVPSIAVMRQQVDELFDGIIKNIHDNYPRLGRFYCATGGFHVELCITDLAIGKSDSNVWSVRIFFNVDDAESEEWAT